MCVIVNSLPDAILGLRELFDANWELLDSCLTPLVNGIVRVIGDEVRLLALVFDDSCWRRIGCQCSKAITHILELAAAQDSLCIFLPFSGHYITFLTWRIIGDPRSPLCFTPLIHHLRTNSHLPRDQDRRRTVPWHPARMYSRIRRIGLVWGEWQSWKSGFGRLPGYPQRRHQIRGAERWLFLFLKNI